CRYGSDLVYKGYFKDNVRQGFGILENFSAEHPFKYTGQWENDKKNGYGVWEDKERNSFPKFHLNLYFSNRKPFPVFLSLHPLSQVPLQLSWSPFSPWNFPFSRKTFPARPTQCFYQILENFPICEGEIHKNLGRTWKNPNLMFSSQLGLKEFPVEKRWTGIFEQFQEFLQSGCKEEMEESFTGFHIQSSKELRKSQEYLFCQRGTEEISWKTEDILEELIQHQDLQSLQSYLEKALKSSLHPLGKLLRALSVAFQATYSGIGANRHLLGMAQEEVKFYSEKIWEFYQGLLRLALEQKGQAPSEEADPRLKGSSLVLPLILPAFYPELSMLYMLQHQREDDLYCQGIVELSLFSDIQLLEFLDVQKHLWPLKDLTLTSNQRRSLVKDKCFLSATECLQKLITTVDPREKLEILRKTYEELEQTVSRLLEKEFRLPMDDLLPLLMFVVSRAKIQHLGAEIHLIRDLMDPTNQGGMLDFLLTALE
ncbi:AL2CL protein, partial [Cercotrichas coryphoeus]|nr:AL2CL protein [Cercotrichas coryphoeus]